MLELADLMEKHRVEITLLDVSPDYGCSYKISVEQYRSPYEEQVVDRLDHELIREAYKK